MKTKLFSSVLATLLGFGLSMSAAAADCVSGGTIPTGGFTCTVPAGVTSMSLTLTGGAGGMGAASAQATGGQGGSGARCTYSLTTVPGATITITAYAGWAASGNNGGDGGNASATGSGITGTVTANGGLGGDRATSSPGAGGAGGPGSGISCTAGADGADGALRAGAASSANNGTNGSASLTFSGAAAIPTLGEWAMIFMASLMAMFAIRRMRRQ